MKLRDTLVFIFSKFTTYLRAKVEQGEITILEERSQKCGE